MKKTVLPEFSDLNEKVGIELNDSQSVKNIVAIIYGLPMELNRHPLLPLQMVYLSLNTTIERTTHLPR